MVAKMIIEDFIMLGRTFPQQTKNHGITVCACGYSRELRQFLRIYPLKITDKIPKWSICSLILERPRTDTRFESWKIIDYKIVGKVEKDEGYSLLFKEQKESINVLNKQKVSLGILHPKSIHFVLKANNQNDIEHREYSTQLNLFGNNLKLYSPPFIPYLQVTNLDNTVNNLQLRDWGVSEFLRKGNDPRELYKSLKFHDSNYDHLLIVGNMKTFKKSWLVISTVFTKNKVESIQDRTNQLILF